MGNNTRYGKSARKVLAIIGIFALPMFALRYKFEIKISMLVLSVLLETESLQICQLSGNTWKLYSLSQLHYSPENKNLLTLTEL